MSIQAFEYLTENKQKIETDYFNIKENSKESFIPFVQKMISTAENLSKNLGKENEIEKHLLNLCSDYSVFNKGLTRFWLYKAFDKELLHYNVLTFLSEKDREEHNNYPDEEQYQKFPVGSSITHKRNKELFEKKFGLLKCETYIEKRKFLEKCEQDYLEKYLLTLNDLSAQAPEGDNFVYPGLTDMQFYNQLFEITVKEKELLDKKEETRLFEENSLSYFISEDILGQLNNILTKDSITPEEDKNRLWRLLRFGSTLSKKISIDLSPIQLAHTFYQLAEKKLVLKNKPIDLSEWLFKSFAPRRSKNSEDKLLAPDTMRRYINERKKEDMGKEIFIVVKIKKTNSGPRYGLEEVWD